MIRTITIVSAFLLMTGPITLAEDREYSLPNLGSEQQYLYGTDTNMSLQEYEGIYSRNQKFVLNNLMSYSENVLESVGVSEQGINLMGATLGLVFSDPKLNLNNSKTLSLEIKDAEDSDRTFYFGINLDW